MNELIQLLTSCCPTVNFATTNNLVTDGILDSYDLVIIISELEKKYDIDINLLDFNPEDFDSVESIFKIINSLTE